MKILIVCVLFLGSYASICGQSILWINEPFTPAAKSLSFARDSVCFLPNSTMLGLVHIADLKAGRPVIDVSIKNTLGDEAKVSFLLKSFHPNQYNWHPLVQYAYKSMLGSPNWYYFDITSFPSVVDAKNGVEFLSVLFNEAVHSEDKQIPAQIFYKLSKANTYRSCHIDFRKEAGYFNYLWERLQFYAILIDKQAKNTKDLEQLVDACRDYGVQQIAQWADQSEQLSQKSKAYDLALFKEIERLKIITETLADTVSGALKIRLRGLLLLDVAILENKEVSGRLQLLKRRSVLLQELGFFPELKSVLWTYTVLSKELEEDASDKLMTDKMLKDVRKRYVPYQQIYQSIVSLKKEKTVIDRMLLKFD